VKLRKKKEERCKENEMYDRTAAKLMKIPTKRKLFG
jgi:hypothetical protein